MHHTGFHWSLKREGDGWRWRAVAREDGVIVAEGLAATRQQGAAFLARFMSRAVLQPQARVAA